MIIKIKNLHAKTIIGVYDWEKEVERELLINIDIEIDGTKAVATDNVDNTVNYYTLSLEIMEKISQTRFVLLEKLVAHVLDIVMLNPLVLRAKVEIDKGDIVKGVDNVSVIDERKRN